MMPPESKPLAAEFICKGLADRLTNYANCTIFACAEADIVERQVKPLTVV